MNMKNEEIIAKINEFLVEEFEVEADTITPDAILKDTLGLDSLDYIDLVVVIESNFSFKVKPEDFVGIVTFQNFYVISRYNRSPLYFCWYSQALWSIACLFPPPVCRVLLFPFFLCVIENYIFIF